MDFLRPDRLLLALTWALLAGGPLSVAAQMIPDAPILHFRLPMFGEEGYKTWELRGLSGTPVSEVEVSVEGLELLVFSGTADLLEKNRIRSPRALIDFDRSEASGETSIFVTGPGYTIQGSNWMWEGKADRITVREAVRVTFVGELSILE
jgi:hypothetical protein